METSPLTLNKISNKNIKVDDPDILLKSYLKPDNKSEEATRPANSELTEKLTKLKSDRESFNNSEEPDRNLLNEYLPRRKSIENDPEKLQQYDDLINKILQKSRFQKSEEGFDKDTKLSDLTKLKPMDRFLSHLVAGLMVELYGREDLIDKVLNNPKEFTVNVLQNNKDSEIAANYSSDRNFILLDEQALFRGLLNLKEPDNVTEDLDSIKQAFTHALDVALTETGL